MHYKNRKISWKYLSAWSEILLLVVVNKKWRTNEENFQNILILSSGYYTIISMASLSVKHCEPLWNKSSKAYYATICKATW